MRPPALERHGTAILDVACRAVKPAVHHVDCFGKGHALGKPADLGRVHAKDGEDHNASLPDHFRDTERFVKNFRVIGAGNRYDPKRPRGF
jgi:hypothetical protein